MEGEEITPSYSVLCEEGKYIISGIESSSGEKTRIVLSTEEKEAFELMEILNRNKVSVHHAKNVIRDILLAKIGE